MQSETRADEETDLASAIVVRMQEQGVAGLPRNYEIFYEAYSGSNDSLRQALARLGPQPAQPELDLLARDYFAQNNRESIVETAHDMISRKLDIIMGLLLRERTSLEKYGVILDRTSEGLSGTVSREMLRKVIGIMAAATDTTIAQGRQLASSMSDTSAELAEVKLKLEEYKRLADTDPLTQAWNRRAFDRAMANVYADRRSTLFSALILADIDRFKDVNDRHGHPVGDKILQHVARIFRANCTANVFIARTGGEEFAMIVEGLAEDAVTTLADNIRGVVERTPFITQLPGALREVITISLGICMATEASDADDLYTKADRALYASKIAGRNRVTRYPVPVAPGLRKNWMLYRNE